MDKRIARPISPDPIMIAHEATFAFPTFLFALGPLCNAMSCSTGTFPGVIRTRVTAPFLAVRSKVPEAEGGIMTDL